MTFLGVIYGYTQSFSLSKFDRFSYAEADNWSNCDTSDLVTAFRYYCKSRNLAIEGSIADALTSFTTTTFNNICSTLGIDPTSLQAELKKTTAGNLGLRFLFSQTGITAYNRIFAEFLQNNDLAVGDTVDDETIYSGESFTDADGNTCLVWDMPKQSQGYIGNSVPNKYGSTYKYDGYTVKNIYDNGVRSLSFTIPRINNSNYSISKNLYTWVSDRDGLKEIYSTLGIGTEGWPQGVLYSVDRNNTVINGKCIVYHINGGSDLYLGQFVDFRGSNTDGGVTANCRWYNYEYFTSPDGLEDVDIYMTTNNNTINNNTYNNNYTIIYNDGDTYYTDDDDEPGPNTQPGGGGGGDNPDQPDPTPSGPDLPDWQPPSGTGTIGSDGTFDFDIPFSLPNLNIDWSLKDIAHKFPFCIPGDIVSFYQTLAVEPRAPSIDAHIPLGSFYDWHFVADFSQYDRWAVIIRAVEYVGFVIGLIYFTVRMVKG